MPIGKRTTIGTFAIDAALVGLWRVGAIDYRIDTDGWHYVSVGSLPYEISPDGQILKYPSIGTVTVYQRILGSGTSIVGVWERAETDSSGNWKEEIHFRTNGTYTIQWFLNGTFESEGLGNYSDQLTTIWSEERSALIETTAPNILTFDPIYTPSETGTYSVDPGGNQWTYHGQAGDIVYTRI